MRSEGRCSLASYWVGASVWVCVSTTILALQTTTRLVSNINSVVIISAILYKHYKTEMTAFEFQKLACGQGPGCVA